MIDFNGSKLRLARNRRGWSASRLARELGVSLRTVQRWEGDSVSPSPETVEALAALLDFRANFLYGEDIEALPLEKVSFRALSKMSAGARDGAISAGRIGTQISDWILKNYIVPTEDLPTLTGYDPEVAAAVMRARWGKGDAPVPNLLHLLESHGIRIFGLDPAFEHVDAFSFISHTGPIIFLNTGKSGERQRFDLAHELGHLVMHQEATGLSTRSIEQQAHRFAAAFLMPRPDVVAQPLWGAGLSVVLAAKERWRVSAMALTHRLRELEMLTEWSYRDLCVQLSKEGYRSQEKFRPIVPETSLLLKKLLSADSMGPRFAELAAQLGLTDGEFKRYIYGLLPTSVAPGQGPQWQLTAPEAIMGPLRIVVD